MSEVRVRMAPSPTGPIHVGNCRTALFNWLFARSQGGVFILRFEDTDQERSRPEWEQQMYEDLRWLGLDWDEGPDVGGPSGPYRQMERLDLYRQYADRLEATGHAYRCYCSEEEISRAREVARQNKLTYKYNRRCRSLDAAVRQQYAAEGRPYVLRFAVPDGQTVAFDDLLHGVIETPTDSIGDFVVMRANGIPLYNFAVVIDDHTMRISHVLRGEGHISNTPVQLLVYRALGLPEPRFGHVGHVTGMNRAKFSKRKGEGSVRDFKEAGYLPEALLNFMALLGWTPETGEIVSRDEMIRLFRIEDLTKAAAAFDRDKLDWMNGHYIRQRSRRDWAEAALPFVVAAGMISETAALARWEWFEEVMAQIQERVRTLAEIPQATAFFFNDQITVDAEAEAKFLTQPHIGPFFQRLSRELAGLPEWSMQSVETAIRTLMADMGLKPKESMQPLRVALTGGTVSPGLFETAFLIGRERVLRRLAPYVSQQ